MRYNDRVSCLHEAHVSGARKNTRKKECEEILANPQKYKGYRNVDELFEELLRD